mmetsp:Transcript_7654/g.25212  ORF Transcript_7654/g.25212 Transcript_7654/m.25212 type:complete len:206 (-) Transcript_7654:319-936(-)
MCLFFHDTSDTSSSSLNGSTRGASHRGGGVYMHMRMTGRAHCASAAGLPSRAGSSPPLSPPLGSRARASWCWCASTNRIPGPDAACLHATATCRATHRSRERATCAAASWRASGAAAAASATPGAATGAAAEIDALVDGWRWSERDGRARLPRSRGAATTAASAALRTTSSSGIALHTGQPRWPRGRPWSRLAASQMSMHALWYT